MLSLNRSTLAKVSFYLSLWLSWSFAAFNQDHFVSQLPPLLSICLIPIALALICVSAVNDADSSHKTSCKYSKFHDYGFFAAALISLLALVLSICTNHMHDSFSLSLPLIVILLASLLIVVIVSRRLFYISNVEIDKQYYSNHPSAMPKKGPGLMQSIRLAFTQVIAALPVCDCGYWQKCDHQRKQKAYHATNRWFFLKYSRSVLFLTPTLIFLLLWVVCIKMWPVNDGLATISICFFVIGYLGTFSRCAKSYLRSFLIFLIAASMGFVFMHWSFQYHPMTQDGMPGVKLTHTVPELYIKHKKNFYLCEAFDYYWLGPRDAVVVKYQHGSQIATASRALSAKEIAYVKGEIKDYACNFLSTALQDAML